MRGFYDWLAIVVLALFSMVAVSLVVRFFERTPPEAAAVTVLVVAALLAADWAWQRFWRPR